MRGMLALMGMLLFCGPAVAEETTVAGQLDALGYEYEVDDDGDYRLVFEVDEQRTQLVFVLSGTETYGSHEVREVWAPAYRAVDDGFPVEVANRLLAASHENKLGAWVKQDGLAVYVVKLPAGASSAQLSDAMEYAANVADRMEAALSDGEDEF
ncbi:YbjN domain-containing protein [Marilutibacter alkalisoli]|nr:YbjN domain-containing protein [Lysobacter alkalisoli]